MAHANLRDYDRNCRPLPPVTRPLRPARLTRLHANPPVPGRKNPEPDEPAPPGRDDENEPLPDEDDAERHRPGRDAHATACF